MTPFVVRWIKLSLVAVVGCGFLAMAIYAFVMRDEIRNAQVEPPLVAAPAEALKRRPEQPGGMEIPNQDKLVFDLLDANSPTVSAVDQVSVAESVEPVTDEQMAAAGDVSPSITNAEVVAAVEPSAAEVSGSRQVPVAAVAAAVAAPVVAAARAEPELVQSVKTEEPKVAEKPKVEVKPVETAVKKAVVEEKPKVVAEDKKSSIKAGSWGVQLAAVGSRGDAEKAVADAKKKFKALASLKPNIQATPDGKHFRVQFFGAGDRAQADQVCSKVKPALSCFPVQSK